MSVVHPIKRVAIIGANGFTGSPLASRLRTLGCSVSGFGYGQDSSWGVAGQLTDGLALDCFFARFAPEAVIHLAGVASPVHGSVAEIYDANVTGTATLLQAILNAPVTPKIVLVASSATVYANSSGAKAITERDKLEPQTHYAISKFTTEKICELYSKKLNIRVVRPFNYTGPGQSENFLVPKIVAHFVADAGIIELGNIDLERDISDINDIVECYVRLIDCGGGNPVNLCAGSAVKLSNILGILTEISGKTLVVRTNPHYVRSNEPFRIFGSRQQLDKLIGTWPRKELYETLNSMYRQGCAAAHVDRPVVD